MKKLLKKASITVASACLVAAGMCSAGWAQSDPPVIELKSHQVSKSGSDSPPRKFNEVSSEPVQDLRDLTIFGQTSSSGVINSGQDNGPGGTNRAPEVENKLQGTSNPHQKSDSLKLEPKGVRLGVTDYMRFNNAINGTPTGGWRSQRP